jgi:hypothetical protein
VQESEVALELVGVEEAGLELGEDREERVREAGEACRASEPVQRRPAQRAARDEGPLGVARHGTRVGVGERELLEDVVERSDRAGEQRTGPAEQIALDPLDVRPVRHDQHRIAVDRIEVTLEETRDLAGLRRPHDQCETHPAHRSPGL